MARSHLPHSNTFLHCDTPEKKMSDKIKKKKSLEHERVHVECKWCVQGRWGVGVRLSVSMHEGFFMRGFFGFKWRGLAGTLRFLTCWWGVEVCEPCWPWWVGGGGGEVRGRGLEATWSKVMAAAFKSDRLKVHYVVSVGKVLIRRERSPLTAYTNSPHVLYWINRPTVKDNTISYCFALFVFGGPHHISSFWLIFLWEQLVYSVMGGEKIINIWPH